MRSTHRMTAGALALFFGAGMCAAPVIANADNNGARNTAIALGALSAGLLLTQHNKTPGIVAGVGALIAASQIKRHSDYRDGYYGGGGYYGGSYDRGHDWNRDGYSTARYDRGSDWNNSNRYDRRYDRGDDWNRSDRADAGRRDWGGRGNFADRGGHESHGRGR